MDEYPNVRITQRKRRAASQLSPKLQPGCIDAGCLNKVTVTVGS